MWGRIGLLALAPQLAACSASEPPEAQSMPMRYRLGVFDAEPQERARRDVRPVFFIDGVQTELFETEYSSEDAADGDEHIIEMHIGSVVVSHRVYVDIDGYCLGPTKNAVDYSISFCAFESGDIRYASDSALEMGPNGSSHVGECDGFCKPACYCDPWEHCTSRVVSTSPVVSHLGCAPIGLRVEGESCVLTPAPDGAYDDCGKGLLCVGGTCHRVCGFWTQVDCDECVYVEGHAPEMRVCID